MACLWDRWTCPHQNRGQEVGGTLELLFFTMPPLNADQHPVMSRMHPPQDEKRMPLVLLVEQFDAWLRADPSHAQGLVSANLMLSLLKLQAHPRPHRNIIKGKVTRGDNQSTDPEQLNLF